MRQFKRFTVWPFDINLYSPKLYAIVLLLCLKTLEASFWLSPFLRLKPTYPKWLKKLLSWQVEKLPTWLEITYYKVNSQDLRLLAKAQERPLRMYVVSEKAIF